MKPWPSSCVFTRYAVGGASSNRGWPTTVADHIANAQQEQRPGWCRRIDRCAIRHLHSGTDHALDRSRFGPRVRPTDVVIAGGRYSAGQFDPLLLRGRRRAADRRSRRRGRGCFRTDKQRIPAAIRDEYSAERSRSILSDPHFDQYDERKSDRRAVLHGAAHGECGRNDIRRI